MNVGISLLHIDCVTRTERSPAPPKMQMAGQDGKLYGHCPACNAWVEVEMTPLDDPPIDNYLPIPNAAEA